MRYTDYEYRVPEEKICRVIVDTDAKNEADDQFAIVQALLTPKFENIAFIAAHFAKPGSMERSYEELERVFDHMDLPKDIILHGAEGAMQSNELPILNEGAAKIIEEAMRPDVRPLYVLFLGAITDLAVAYLHEPRIAGRLTAIWIGGGPYPHGGKEFNLGNDIAAANIVFGSEIALWQIPKNVYEMMAVSMAELEWKVAPCARIGRYLFQQLNEHVFDPIPRKSPFRTGEAWTLGDNPAVGALLYGHRFNCKWIQAPLITQDMTYVPNELNRPIRVFTSIDNRLILEDMFAKLALYAQKHS